MNSRAGHERQSRSEGQLEQSVRYGSGKRWRQETGLGPEAMLWRARRLVGNLIWGNPDKTS